MHEINLALNSISRVALGFLMVALFSCCQRAPYTEYDNDTVHLVVDFHTCNQTAISIPVEIAPDSFMSIYELVKASGLQYELHPKYSTPPAVLLQRIEGEPSSLTDDRFWAVFINTGISQPWIYQKAGISEVEVSSGMTVGFSLSRWRYVDDVFTPLDLPCYVPLPKEEFNTPKAVQVKHKYTTEPVANHNISVASPEATGCGWNSPNTTVKLLPQFSGKTIEEAVKLMMRDPNKLSHLFAPKHKLGPLVGKLGGQQNTVKAVLNAANGKLPSSGVSHNISVQVHGQTVIIRGNVINGIPRLGTMYIP